MSSLSVKSKQMLEELGYHVAITEHWNSFARKRFDLFSIADLMAVAKNRRPLLVQTTSRANMSSRRRKILGSEALAAILGSGIDIHLHGWDQPLGPRTKWRVKIEEIKL